MSSQNNQWLSSRGGLVVELWNDNSRRGNQKKQRGGPEAEERFKNQEGGTAARVGPGEKPG